MVVEKRSKGVHGVLCEAFFDTQDLRHFMRLVSV